MPPFSLAPRLSEWQSGKNGDDMTSACIDLGGTNARFGVVDADGINSVTRYRNADFPNFSELLKKALTVADTSIDRLCVAVAGPVSDGRVEMTNLGWVLDERALAAEFDLSRVVLMNDLQAQGYGLKTLTSDKLIPLIPGNDAPKAPKLIMGLGTGVNAIIVHQIAGKTFVPAAEAGHALLASAEPGLGAFLEEKEGSASIEAALCGRGVLHLSEFMAAKQKASAYATHSDLIAGFDAGEPVAQETLALYARAAGAALGDLALIHLPLGGIYLIGGVARGMKKALELPDFSQSFSRKGRFGEFMEQFSISIIDDDFLALRGCEAYLLEQG